MNTLPLIRRIALTLLALFSSTMLWAQTLTVGSGTENDPYIINSATDWNTFASSSVYWASGVCVRLDADITVSTMVGTSTNKYSGTFDGNWHRLTFNCGTLESPYNQECCAPFSYIDGATIKNLTVDGTIVSKKKYAAGLIGWAQNSNPVHITNCTSHITINCSEIEKGTSGKEYDCSTGGFIGQIESGNVFFENCIFDGLIDKGTQESANRCAGFVSYVNNNGRAYYTHCTMAGTITLTSYLSTYNRNGKNSFSEAYYINDYGDVTNCTQATTTEPTDVLARKHTLNNTAYFVPGSIVTGLETTTYSYIEGQSVTITPVVTYYGKMLTRGTDYIIKIDDSEVPTATTPTLSAAGEHAFAIEGIGNYGGAQTTTIKVTNFNSWAILQEVLADASKGDRNITLNDDISPELESDHYLEVNGNVVLNLNGKTINRHLTDSLVYGQVIRVSAGANLTINGPGTITGGYNWPGSDEIPSESTYYDKRDGGGIHNMGNLVLNNVNVENNKCGKEAWGSSSYSARGGGIYSGTGSSLVINGGSIENNIARGGGGGIFSEGAHPFTMTDTKVNYNQSESKGGGIRVKTTGSHVATFTGCSLVLNIVTDNVGDGGGVYFESGELHLTNCDIMGNQSRYRGCGFYSVKGKTIATNCNISYNGSFSVEDTNYGGGICLSSQSVFIMDGGTVESNNSNANGGGIYLYDGAKFQVKGNVQIIDNYKASVATGAFDNNAYPQGSSVIEVIEPLEDDAIIAITPIPNRSSPYVTFADGISTESALSHFKLDNDEYRMILVDGNVEAYELYPWDATSTWNGTIATDLKGSLPTASSAVTINRTVKIPSGCVASAYTIDFGDYGEIVIEDGAQLIHGNNVRATLQKKISAYTINENNGDSKTDGWYTIASPVTGSYSTEGITTTSYGVYYDLYRYDEPTHFWQNAKGGDGHGFNTLNNGQGYLYAHKPNITLNFTGTMQATNSTVSIPLSYTEDAGDMKGYNLVGNPFTCNITGNAKIVKGATSQDLTTYYYIAGGSELTTTTLSERPIQPGEGFFVQATESGQSLVFNDETPSLAEATNSPALLRIEAGDDLFTDRALLQFGNGNTLRKIIINEDVPHLSLQLGKADYASAAVEAAQGTVPVSFKPATNGTYTITVSPEGVEMGYLHLVDNLTGTDTDLLSSPTYTFSARSDDYASRFRLVYSATQVPEYIEQPASFAFISNGQIILTGVDGNTTLQVMDMTGRVILCRAGACTVSTTGIAPGLYILRLIHNDDVKTQKIIVQ